MTNTTKPEFNKFANRLRILLNIESFELDGILKDDDEWREFRQNPWRWMIHTDSARANQVFDLMLKRESKIGGE